MGPLEFAPWVFYTTGGFLVLLGWFIGLADSALGNVLLVIGFAIIAIGKWVAVRDSKKLRIQQEWLENLREDAERSRDDRLAREKEVAEKWWRDTHRGLWDPSYIPWSAALPRTSKDGDWSPDSEAASGSASEDEWLNNRSRPAQQIYGVSSRGAEEITADWLRFLGEKNIKITPISQDGGADVLTASYCCQVKNYEKKPVGVMEVRALLGAAVSSKLLPLLFTASKPTNEALIFSNENDIAIIQFDAANALLYGLTTQGHLLLKKGRYLS